MEPISEVYNCDCLEYMRGLPDNAFDLVIADPPYGGANNPTINGGRFGQRFDRYKASTSSSTAAHRKTGCTSTEKLEEVLDSTKEEPG